MVGVAPGYLAFMFGIHIAMVNLGIGLAWLVPYLKWRADRGEAELDPIARSLMRFYAATYGVAGVFGTAFTVFLLSYYPKFIGFAGNLTLIPFGLAILAIALHFFSISAFYYGWDRWSRPVHHFIGLLLGVSALLIPLGFRAVFAFLNIPSGLTLDPATGKLYLDVTEALTRNPTYWPLYIKSIAASMTATFLVVAGAYAYKAVRGQGGELYARVAGMLVKPALAALLVTALAGVWYALELRAIPYKFNNVFASLGWRVADGVAQFDVSWLFIIKMLFVLVQFVALGVAIRALARGRLGAGEAKLLLVGGLAALGGVVSGEYLNAFSQYPFFIAVWPDVLSGKVTPEQLASYGVNIPPSAIPEVVNTVNSLVLLEGGRTVASILSNMGLGKYFNLEHVVNSIAVEPGVVAVTAAFVGALMVGVVYLIYILLFPPRTARAVSTA